ncbi:hypothetical protein KILIM_030_00020 [Kineosphaera limosa NBRC 100340]|uniref:Polymerase/histidinol phosphatase N-terminal domain-containing protein n=1 Tax=Kineosphaera limosa NBRC 100340 TaxID=1184609 RepID=K6W9T2_9MICO|nr:hypothetical protein KILIM_030_00020 [Kineosphaera limosa NBRC 100340]
MTSPPKLPVVRIDLHTHSDASDGTGSPGQVVAEAAAAGLDVVALTDHDSTRGWDEASRAAREHGIDLLPGMEISCTYYGTSIHLLSYLHDPQFEPLLAQLEHARASRDTRAQRIVDRLATVVPLTWDQVRAQVSDGATVGRPHIADALVASGAVADRTEAFDRYLYNGSPYYASHYAIDVLEAIELVRAAGGVPVFAHPFAQKRGRIVDESVIAQMRDAGLVGIEVNHPDHDPAQTRRALEAARTFGLLVTGSSDYHGDGKPNRLGEQLTSPQVLAQILARASGSEPVLARG